MRGFKNFEKTSIGDVEKILILEWGSIMGKSIFPEGNQRICFNRVNMHVEKCVLFSDFQYVFRSFLSTANLLTFVSDRIARAFNRSGATRAVTLDISKAFDRVWHAGLLLKLRSDGISDQIFGLTSSFLSNRRLRVVVKSSQENPVNAGIPQGSILVPTLFLLYISDLPNDVIFNIANYADDTTLYSKCNQASDLWQQLEHSFLPPL